MFRAIYSLFSGVVFFAALLTAIVYLWAINRSTIYERRPPADQPAAPHPGEVRSVTR